MKRLFACVLLLMLTSSLPSTAQNKPILKKGNALKNDTVYKSILMPEEYKTFWTRKANKYRYDFALGADRSNQVYLRHLTSSNKFEVAICNYDGVKTSFEMDNKPDRLLIDTFGNIYITAAAREGYDMRWQIFKIENGLPILYKDCVPTVASYTDSYVTLGKDNKFYLVQRISQRGDSVDLRIQILNNSGWENASFSIYSGHNFRCEDLIVNQEGQPFIKIVTPGAYASIYGLNGGTWQNIFSSWQSNIFFDIDQDNNIVYGVPICSNCINSGKIFFWKKNAADSVQLPPGDFEQIMIRGGKLYDFQRETNRDERVVYVLNKNKEWKQVTRFTLDHLEDWHVFFNDSLFINFSSSTLFTGVNHMVSESSVAIQKSYRIKPPTGLSLTPGDVSVLAKYRILELNGKLGICDEHNETLVYPFFDKITLEKMSDKNSGNLFFQFSVGNAVYNVSLQSLYRPDKFQDINVKEMLCSKCKGLGKLPDRVEKIEIEGEWVPEKSTSSTGYKYNSVWNTNCNCYVGKTTMVTKGTSTPGYRKPSTYEYKKIKGGVCDVCHGSKTQVQVKYLVWDWSTKTYTEIWK